MPIPLQSDLVHWEQSLKFIVWKSINVLLIQFINVRTSAAEIARPLDLDVPLN